MAVDKVYLKIIKKDKQRRSKIFFFQIMPQYAFHDKNLTMQLSIQDLKIIRNTSLCDRVK